LKHAPISQQCVSLYSFWMDGKELDDTYIFAWVSQCFIEHYLCASCFSFILGVFFTNSMVFKLQSNFSIHTLCTTP
jgi:hypothetical protein